MQTEVTAKPALTLALGVCVRSDDVLSCMYAADKDRTQSCQEANALVPWEGQSLSQLRLREMIKSFSGPNMSVYE